MKIRSKILIAIILLSGIFPLTFINKAFAHSLGGITTIHMTENGFEPGEVEIKNGDTVIFENIDSRDRWPASNIHPTHEIFPEFDSKKPIKPKGTWGFKLEKTGTFRFHDHLYPQLTGTITVRSGEELKNLTISKENTNHQSENTITKLYQNVKSYINKFLSFFAGFVEKNQNKSSQKASIENLPKYNLESVFEETNFKCEKTSFTCANNILKEVTGKYGPQASIELLEKLQKAGLVLPSVDDHQLAHEIGRQTATTFKVNAESFLLCPMSSYNGGCQHGFFETALGQAQNSKEAIDLICGSLDGDAFSSKFRFYCYHGVGHGLMMAQANDLNASLSTCDSLSEPFAQDGCWQGVFMENANTGMRHEAKEGVFSQTDPLAPCNTIAEKYRHECFINHAGPLVNFFKNDVEAATLSCLKAPDNYVSSCLQSIGLMVTNPVWQPQLLKNPVPKNLGEGAWEICLKFPKNHRDQCVMGAVDNVMNFNELQTEEADSFCNIVASNYQNLCYQKIGANLRNQTTDSSIVLQKCSEIENDDFRKSCIKGAGL